MVRERAVVLFRYLLMMAVGCGSSPDRPNAVDASEDGVLRCPQGDVAVASQSVTVRDFQFVPACIVIPAGSAVTWTNAGRPTQSVTSAPSAPVNFDSGALGPRGTFSFTFTSPGVISYHSMPFRVLGMQGAVIVR